MKKEVAAFFLVGIVLLAGCVQEKVASYTAGKLQEPSLVYTPLAYSFTPQQYNSPEYDLPLTELPENYQRDIVERFRLSLTDGQKKTLLDNGVLIVPEADYDQFQHAYSKLSSRDVPSIITTDSVMHLFHIEFNELLKNLEITKLDPMLNSFLDATLKTSTGQYAGLQDPQLKELARRNIAYLAVAKKLLDPEYSVPDMVAGEVGEEIKRIEEHKGFYRNRLMSKDCPQVCTERLYRPDDVCTQQAKGTVVYEGKSWDFIELYKEVCSRKCYCEDYSQYVPRGHYTSSEQLKQYFKAMMWLGRITFKARGDEWTKQAVFLTDAVKSAQANYEGKDYKAIELWNKIYTVTGFFAGASDDLTFYEYDTAVFNLFNYEFDENDKLKEQLTDAMQTEIGKLRGPKILGGFEFDLAGGLKDLTQGLRLMGQRYAVDSHVLGELVYKNVGPNPASPYYEEVLTFAESNGMLSKPKEFYDSCDNMAENKTKYWNEVCDATMWYFCVGDCSPDLPIETAEKIYSVCRFMPTGLDVMSALGSKRADELLEEQKMSTYCDYTGKNQEMGQLVAGYDQKEWTKNLYNAWLWMLQPVIREKPIGYPNWMRSPVWKTKDLTTALSSWAELRHDTILYVKQSYTWAVSITTGSIPPMEAKYYGYVEPNPELYARANFLTQFLKHGLEEQGVMTDAVAGSLDPSSEMMERLQTISQKELAGEELTEDDYNYIKSIDETFTTILENLASAMTVEEGSCPLGEICGTEKELGGEDDAFKTSLIADVHTETNTKKVLEVGTGKVDWLLVAHKAKDGRIGIGVGPTFSYYEFPWKMSDRLTDEKWREMLDKTPPERPTWLK